MSEIDRQRMIRSIEYALKTLETEAFCFGYSDEPEHIALIAELQRRLERIKSCS